MQTPKPARVSALRGGSSRGFILPVYLTHDFRVEVWLNSATYCGLPAEAIWRSSTRLLYVCACKRIEYILPAHSSANLRR